MSLLYGALFPFPMTIALCPVIEFDSHITIVLSPPVTVFHLHMTVPHDPVLTLFDPMTFTRPYDVVS